MTDNVWNSYARERHDARRAYEATHGPVTRHEERYGADAPTRAEAESDARELGES